MSIDNREPIQIQMSISSMNDAIEYWLGKAVLRNDIKIESITFNERDHFTIKFNREINDEDK